MMPLDDDKWRQKLIRAYQSRPDIEIPNAWSQTVMREIRQIGATGPRASFAGDFGAFVWRLAPAAGILLILLIAGGVWLSPSPDKVIADLFLADPVDFIFGDILGV